MDSRYGRQDIPNKIPAGEIEEKYWGCIQTIYADDEFTLKEIFMKAGTQSSMEYHLQKDEKYYIQSGKLRLGLRIGRAQNKSIPRIRKYLQGGQEGQNSDHARP